MSKSRSTKDRIFNLNKFRIITIAYMGVGLVLTLLRVSSAIFLFPLHVNISSLLEIIIFGVFGNNELQNYFSMIYTILVICITPVIAYVLDAIRIKLKITKPLQYAGLVVVAYAVSSLIMVLLIVIFLSFA